MGDTYFVGSVRKSQLQSLYLFLKQWLSNFAIPRLGNFYFYKTRARYWAAVRRLRNTVQKDPTE
jgi:hypothetical protein